MGSCTTTSKLCAALLLVAINLVLMGGGIMILVAAIKTRNSGWVEVVESYWSSINDVLTALEVVGAVIIGLAALGTLAACCRWRMGLLLYAVVVFFVLVLFVGIGVVAFIVQGKADDWNATSYPATDDEPSIKEGFDKAYCYAQGAYICNEMTLSDASTTFFPGVLDAARLEQFSRLEGVNAICSAVLPTLSTLEAVATVPPQLKDVCKACVMAKDFASFSSILDWANDQCPRTSATLSWCGMYLATSNAASVSMGTAPYTKCRPEFLDLVSGTSFTVGVVSVIVGAGAFLIIIFACFLRCRGDLDKADSKEETETLAEGHEYGTPRTAQPYVGGQPTHEQLYGKA